jgi:signal transduction histidine kinase/CheY-like chemotaxis protein
MIKLKIATKIGILASVLVLCSAIYIGKRAEEETVRYNINNEIEETYRYKLLVDKIPFAQEFIENLLKDVRLQATQQVNSFVIVSHLAELQGHEQARLGDKPGREDPWNWDWKEKKGQLWAPYLDAQEEYLEVCLLDRNGKELVRVHRGEEGVVIVPEEELWTHSEREWVRNTIALGETRSATAESEPVFLSRIRLDREGPNRDFTLPFEPVISAAAPIYTPSASDFSNLPADLTLEGGSVFGLVAITMKLDTLIDRLTQVRDTTDSKNDPSQEAPERIFVTDGEGYFVSHPNEPVLYGFEEEIRFAQRDRRIMENKIQEIYPELDPSYASAQIEAASRIHHEANPSGEEGYFVKRLIGPGNSQRALGLAMVSSYEALLAKARTGSREVYQSAIALGLVASLFGFFALTWLLRHLKPLSVSAAKIAGGDYDVPLPPITGDEIGELAQAFSMMVERVKEREEDLRQHRDNLEDEVERRTEALQKAHDALSQHSEALKKTNVELAVARDRALEAGRAKTEFFAKMSHELKSPLTVIILAAESLEEEAEELEMDDLSGEIRDILVAAWTLYEQITSILDTSKIEAGKLEVNLSTFDLRELVDTEIRRPVRYLAAKRNNEFEVRFEEGLEPVQADPNLVKNALYNLLSNACKFTQEGKVILEVGQTNKDGIDFVRMTVSDTGIGMSEKETHKLFKVFSQVDASTASRYGGHGLGLANVKSYCQLMGGEVTVESHSGAGSTFTILIPKNVRPEEIPPPAPPVPSEALEAFDGSRSVLVIDDDPGWRENLLRTLTREGFHTVTASSGEEGLRLAKQLRPAVITLDVNMPTMDGWAVLAEMKADPELAEIPVVMLTLTDNKKVGFALGASDYLTKPLNRDRLISVLHKHLDGEGTGPILIVEDEPGIRSGLRSILAGEGYEVVEAENGKVALLRLEEIEPRIILLDLMMPEMDGFEFVERVQTNEVWRSIPVVVLTALPLSEEDRERLNGWVETVLQKEKTEPKTVLEEVRRLVSRHVAETQ